ncbi:hypothetical protein [Kribbella sp. NPDC000426]|uniref:hypothetical protein n=1 Tax=Kribbella sp. NPDC000426 TaxID=3154255 RepID=UPI0033171992
MGWISDDLARHEGYLAVEFADGVRSSGFAGDSAVIMLMDEFGEYTGQDEHRPVSEVVGWRLMCDCIPASVSNERLMHDGYFGRKQQWVGQFWERVANKDDENLSQHRIYADLDDPHGVGIFVDDRDVVGRLVREEWRSLHVNGDPNRPVTFDPNTAGVSRAAAAVDAARALLDEEVAAARAAGSSWADIGLAAGISRQSAHERWGRYPLAHPTQQTKGHDPPIVALRAVQPAVTAVIDGKSSGVASNARTPAPARSGHARRSGPGCG